MDAIGRHDGSVVAVDRETARSIEHLSHRRLWQRAQSGDRREPAAWGIAHAFWRVGDAALFRTPAVANAVSMPTAEACGPGAAMRADRIRRACTASGSTEQRRSGARDIVRPDGPAIRSRPADVPRGSGVPRWLRATVGFTRIAQQASSSDLTRCGLTTPHDAAHPARDARSTTCFYEPLITFASVAAVTHTIRLSSRDRAARTRARPAGKTDRNAGRSVRWAGDARGRIGAYREEFEAVHPTRAKANRGAMLDEGIAALRCLFESKTATHEGKYLQSRCRVSTKPRQQPFPIYVNAHGDQGLDRVARAGNGGSHRRPHLTRWRRLAPTCFGASRRRLTQATSASTCRSGFARAQTMRVGVEASPLPAFQATCCSNPTLRRLDC